MRRSRSARLQTSVTPSRLQGDAAHADLVATPARHKLARGTTSIFARTACECAAPDRSDIFLPISEAALAFAGGLISVPRSSFEWAAFGIVSKAVVEVHHAAAHRDCGQRKTTGELIKDQGPLVLGVSHEHRFQALALVQIGIGQVQRVET